MTMVRVRGVRSTVATSLVLSMAWVFSLLPESQAIFNLQPPPNEDLWGECSKFLFTWKAGRDPAKEICEGYSAEKGTFNPQMLGLCNALQKILGPSKECLVALMDEGCSMQGGVWPVVSDYSTDRCPEIMLCMKRFNPEHFVELKTSEEKCSNDLPTEAVCSNVLLEIDRGRQAKDVCAFLRKFFGASNGKKCDAILKEVTRVGQQGMLEALQKEEDYATVCRDTLQMERIAAEMGEDISKKNLTAKASPDAHASVPAPVPDRPAAAAGASGANRREQNPVVAPTSGAPGAAGAADPSPWPELMASVDQQSNNIMTSTEPAQMRRERRVARPRYVQLADGDETYGDRQGDISEDEADHAIPDKSLEGDEEGTKDAVDGVGDVSRSARQEELSNYPMDIREEDLPGVSHASGLRRKERKEGALKREVDVEAVKNDVMRDLMNTGTSDSDEDSDFDINRPL